MLTFESGPDARRNWLTRRDCLRVGFLGLGGLTLSGLSRLIASGAARKKDAAVLLLFVHGGPSHLETYDPKPDATVEVRGPFAAIQTRLPGIRICEHLPKHAKVAH